MACITDDGRGVGGGDAFHKEKEKTNAIAMLLLRMAYLNWNDSKIWNIFSFSLQQGGISPFGVEWVGEGPDVTLLVLFG